MQLKVKFLKWSAGRPVAILHETLADKISVHVDDRILLRKNSRKIIAVVDIAKGLLNKNEIAVSTEVSDYLKLKRNDFINAEPALKPESVSLIFKKLKCKVLAEKEIREIISDIVKNALTESEIAYFVSSVYVCGMTDKEVIELTKSIVETGKKLNLKKKLVVDKHSIGGVPGRTTPIVVSICASAGLTMPKTSSRAITTPAGTADALEVLCRVDFSINEIKKIISKTGACMVWGGSLGLAPADDKIIQVERLLNLDPEAQLLASIMAKKVSVGSRYVIIEIPYGKNAKVDKKEALRLEKKFIMLGKSFKIKIKCLLFEAKEPSGDGIGPALEIKDVIRVLKRQSPCHLLEYRSLMLAGQLLEMAGKAKKGRGIVMAKSILNSGLAFKKFKQIIFAQKGIIEKIKEAKFRHDIKAERNFVIKEINIKKIDELARILGCPADKSSGIYLYRHIHDSVKKGEEILTLYSESSSELREAIKFYKKNRIIK